MSEEKVREELNEKLQEADEANSFFATITIKYGNDLVHWQGSVNFPPEDCLPSLNEIRRMVGGKKRLYMVKGKKKENGGKKESDPSIDEPPKRTFD